MKNELINNEDKKEKSPSLRKMDSYNVEEDILNLGMNNLPEKEKDDEEPFRSQHPTLGDATGYAQVDRGANPRVPRLLYSSALRCLVWLRSDQ